MSDSAAVRCTWDNEARAGYVYFDGSKVSDPPIAGQSKYHESMFGVVVDCAEDGTVVGVDLYNGPPTDIEFGGDGLLTAWHWYVIGRAWEQMQQRADERSVVRHDWRLVLGGDEAVAD